jgi:hypothetical protein
MIRHAADETTTRDGRPLGQAGTSYDTLQMDRPLMRGEERASVSGSACKLQGLQDTTALWPHHNRRDGGGCWKVLELGRDAFQHMLTASTVTYDQAEHCPILYAYEPGLIADCQAIGGGPRGRERITYGVTLLRI